MDNLWNGRGMLSQKSDFNRFPPSLIEKPSENGIIQNTFCPLTLLHLFSYQAIFETFLFFFFLFFTEHAFFFLNHSIVPNSITQKQTTAVSMKGPSSVCLRQCMPAWHILTLECTLSSWRIRRWACRRHGNHIRYPSRCSCTEMLRGISIFYLWEIAIKKKKNVDVTVLFFLCLKREEIASAFVKLHVGHECMLFYHLCLFSPPPPILRNGCDYNSW